jgi:hypothetical protein
MELRSWGPALGFGMGLTVLLRVRNLLKEVGVLRVSAFVRFAVIELVFYKLNGLSIYTFDVYI